LIDWLVDRLIHNRLIDKFINKSIYILCIKHFINLSIILDAIGDVIIAIDAAAPF
jgi:hypothetical protein